MFGMVVDKVDEVDAKVKKKIGASDLKTINGESIVGEGDIKVSTDSAIVIYADETSKRNADAFYKIKDLAEKGIPATNVVVVDGVAYSAAVSYGEMMENGVGTGAYIVMAQYAPIDTNPQRTIVTPRILMLGINKDTGEGAAHVIIRGGIDSELSDTSKNPVQNKAIKAYVDSKQAVVYFPVKEEDTLPQEMIASNATAFNLIKNRTSEQPINITVYGYSVNQYSHVGYYLHRYQSIQLMTFGLDTHVICVIPEHIDNLRKHVNTLMIYLHQGGSITLEKYDNYDAELSDTSINAVQNKVVTEKLASLEARIAALEGK